MAQETQSTHTRFNRHEVFRPCDTRMVLDAINEAGDAAFDMSNDKESRSEFRALENTLYGLYDGYLYNSLVSDVERLLSTTTTRDIKLLVGNIKKHQEQK